MIKAVFEPDLSLGGVPGAISSLMDSPKSPDTIVLCWDTTDVQYTRTHARRPYRSKLQVSGVPSVSVLVVLSPKKENDFGGGGEAHIIPSIKIPKTPAFCLDVILSVYTIWATKSAKNRVPEVVLLSVPPDRPSSWIEYYAPRKYLDLQRGMGTSNTNTSIITSHTPIQRLYSRVWTQVPVVPATVASSMAPVVSGQA